MRSTFKAAVILAAVSLVAQTGSFAQDEVYSVNVVGFQKLTAVSSGLTMVSVPFSKSSNTLDGVVGPQLTAGKTSTSADNISIWNAVSQRYETCWLKLADSNWYTLAGAKATNQIITSMGLFVQNRTATSRVVVVSGDVPNASRITNNLLPGLNLVSYPFSTDVDINQSGLTNGKTGKTSSSADNIRIWNSGTKQYDSYWLKTDRKWYTFAGDLASNVRVGFGVGFWYQNRTNIVFDWSEARPYTF